MLRLGARMKITDRHIMEGCRREGLKGWNKAWSSLVEGDEQLSRPNSQTTMELCHACVA